MFAERPRDAYAALAYLQAQPFVRADRSAWSDGRKAGRPSCSRSGPRAAPARTGSRPDFRAAVALYPGLCDEQLQANLIGAEAARSWTTAIPLLVLQGAADNWTPAARCEAFIAGAKARGAPVEFKLYPGAHHTFDAPNQAVRPLPAVPDGERRGAALRHRGCGAHGRAGPGAGIPGAASQRSVARMKRSEIRDRLVPAFRFAPCGLQ